MTSEKQNVKPENEQECSATRRALLRAGWIVPVVLSIATPSFAVGSTAAGTTPLPPP